MTLDFASQQLSTSISGTYSGVLNAFFDLNATESFSAAATNGVMAGSYDSAVDSGFSFDGDGRVILSGVFVNHANGTAGSLVYSVTVIDTVDGQVEGAGVTAKQ